MAANALLDKIEQLKQEAQAKQSKPAKLITPSQLPFPVFTLCPPVYVDTATPNNVWMKKLSPQELKIDKEKFLGQWYNLYNVLAGNSLVYLITPVKGLGDQTYVNSFAYLPHIKNHDVIILSNFTAPGRAGEELVSGGLLDDLGYEVVKPPYKFEGWPELKWIKDNIYLGGYGIRTDIKALHWIEDNFGAEIIPIKETDEKLYHLDCSVFVIDKDSTVVCTEIIDEATIAKIEKVTNIIPVSVESAHDGICNSLKVESCIYNASSLQFMKKSDPDYAKESQKNEDLEKICRQLGQELLFFDLSECEKSGAQLSCFVSPLNFRS